MAAWGNFTKSFGLYRSLNRIRTVKGSVFLSRRPSFIQETRIASVHQFPSPSIKNEKVARTFIVSLDQRSRQLLFQEMENFERDRTSAAGPEQSKSVVSRAELWNVFLFNGIPFVGFGVLDNLIMIVAGEYIDVTLGAVLGISTMAAAGLGNLVSDVAGVGTAGYVEALTTKCGVPVPNLTVEQASQKSTRWSIGLGRAIGISLGCLIGMFPLLFFPGRECSEVSMESPPDEATKKEASST